MRGSIESDRVGRLFESNVEGRHPIGRYFLGFWLSANGASYLLDNLPSLSFSAIEWAEWALLVGAVSAVFFVIGEGIWYGRPIGWYGGIGLGLVFVAIGVSGAAFGDFESTAGGTAAAALLLPYLVVHRPAFFGGDSNESRDRRDEVSKTAS